VGGPLPNPQRRRRNAPTVASSELPAKGRSGPIPAAPYSLEEHGAAWWRWAWRLPQAAKWDAGSLYALARRAQLEDDLRALEEADSFDLAELVGIDEDRDAMRRVDQIVRRLKGLAGGRVSVMREMRELDNRFGLNAKAMAELRWTIEGAPQAEKVERGDVRRLRAVDASA
jgi:hypothetical protein